MSSLYTAISTPSFCSFWHGHPYIPIHFLKMFYILVYIYIIILTCYTKTTQLTLSLHLFFISEIILRVMLQDYWEEQFLSQKKKDVGMGLVV